MVHNLSHGSSIPRYRSAIDVWAANSASAIRRTTIPPRNCDCKNWTGMGNLIAGVSASPEKGRMARNLASPSQLVGTYPIRRKLERVRWHSRSCFASSDFPARFVRFFRQAHELVHDPGVLVCRWIEEQAVLSKADDGGHSAALLSGRRTNDGDRAQTFVQEDGRFGHDQVGLEHIWNVFVRSPIVGIDAGVEVWKRKVAVGDEGRVASLVVPGLEVHDLAAADAEQNPQDFQIGYLLRQRRVQAASALLDECEVESRRVRNRLQMVGDVALGIQAQVGIAQGNGRMLSLSEIWNCVLESSSKVWIRGRAAVPCPPFSVYRQLLQVGEAACLGNARDFTRGQNGKIFRQVDGLSALRLQVVVEKPVMTDLIVSVVGDVLRHIAVEYQEPRDVIWSEPSDDFLAVEFQIDWRLALIGRSAEFGVLNPQVGLDLLQGAQEGQNCDVALGDWRAILVPPECRCGPRQQGRAHGCRPRRHHSVCQESAPVCSALHAVF